MQDRGILEEEGQGVEEAAGTVEIPGFPPLEPGPVDGGQKAGKEEEEESAGSAGDGDAEQRGGEVQDAHLAENVRDGEAHDGDEGHPDVGAVPGFISPLFHRDPGAPANHEEGPRPDEGARPLPEKREGEEGGNEGERSVQGYGAGDPEVMDPHVEEGPPDCGAYQARPGEVEDRHGVPPAGLPEQGRDNEEGGKTHEEADEDPGDRVGVGLSGGG